MGQTGEFVASSLIVRQATRVTTIETVEFAIVMKISLAPRNNYQNT